LDKGDVFQLGGSNYEYRYRRGSKVYVDRTSKAPTVPSWFSERLPLSYDLGTKILEFQEEFIDQLKNDTIYNWLDAYPINQNTKEALVRLYKNQEEYLKDNCVSTSSLYVVEEEINEDDNKRNYYFQSCYGRKFNDGMSRLLAQHFAVEKNVNVQVAVTDQGFALKVPIKTELNIDRALNSIDAKDIRNILRRSLDGTDFLKRYFRINSTRSLMILRNYKGHHKSAKKQQVKSEMLLGYIKDLENVSVLEETYREIMQDKLNINKIESFIKQIQNNKIQVKQILVQTPSPRSFETAALASEDVIAADDQSKVLKEFHNQVISEIDEN
jgi:ATP-dependent Lhr-like helicase